MTTKPTTKKPAGQQPVGKAKAPTKAKAEKKKAKTTTGTITVLAKENPHAEGSNRHGWFKKLKTGMTVAEAVELGVRSIYLSRIAARGLIKIAEKSQ